jgi:hypothetical protein
VTKSSASRAQAAASTTADTPAPTAGEAAENDALVALVGDWVTLPDLAQRWGIPVTRVRSHLADRELLGLRLGPNRALHVPAKFATDTGPRPDLRGTITVLSDGGMDDHAILEWLFTVDPTLRGGGAPIDAMIAGFRTQVRRRAAITAL